MDNKPEVQLSGEVECDGVYITAGRKGQPEVVKKQTARATAQAQKSKIQHPKSDRGAEIAIFSCLNNRT